MKLYITDIAYAQSHMEELRKLRLAGNMVALYSDRNRRSLMRSFYSLANYFIADGGEFVFSGCFTLRAKRSAHTEEVIEILKKHHAGYSFVREVENACGGQLPFAKGNEEVSNDHYNYAVRFDSVTARKEAEKECEGLCRFYDDDEETYLIFTDISLKEAVHDLLISEKIKEENVIFCSGTDA